VSQLQLCHSLPAKRDTESSIINRFWIPALMALY
jgi:hypothetical protein